MEMETLKTDVANMNEFEFTNWIEETFLDGLNKIQICEYFKKLYDEVNKINKTLRVTSIAARTGEISRNPQLHGFLFEKLHVYIFNAKAALAHKNFRAYVLPIDGGGFGKNSVDISIRELGTNKILRNYQAKCCANAEAAIKAFEHGDYRNQRYLVCEGQVEDVKKACSSYKSVVDCIEYDGISSNPLNYSKVKEMQYAMQSGDFSNVDLSMYNRREMIKAGLMAVGESLAIDALFRGVSLAVKHLFLHTETGFKEDFLYEVKELGWDAVKLALSAELNTEIGLKKEYLPNFLKELPNEQIGTVSYIICGLFVDVLRAGCGYATGEYSEVEAYAQVIRSVIKNVCALVGGGVAGLLTEGTGTVWGSVFGGVLGELLVNKIGQERLEKAAQGCIALKDKGKEIYLSSIEKISEFMGKEKQVVLEGI